MSCIISLHGENSTVCYKIYNLKGKICQNLVYVVFETVNKGVLLAGPCHCEVTRQRVVFCADKIRAGDVGLEPDMPYFRASRAQRRMPKITYLHIYECETFSVSKLFFFNC